MQKLLTFFSVKILAYMAYLMIKALANDIFSFEQLGPGLCPQKHRNNCYGLLLLVVSISSRIHDKTFSSVFALLNTAEIILNTMTKGESRLS